MKAAFDYSCGAACFAVLDGSGGIILEESHETPGRDASSLPAWMEGCLQRRRIALRTIEEWSVGIGPGSFTGLRLAVSLISGICFGREGVRMRGVPSSIAMLAALPESASASTPVALYDGRRGETLAFGLKRDGSGFVPSGFTAVLKSAEDAEESLTGHDLRFALERDMGAIGASLGDYAAKVRPVKTMKASALALDASNLFGDKVADLIYLRPPVFVDPKTPRSLK